MKHRFMVALVGISVVGLSVLTVKAADSDTEAVQLQLQQKFIPPLRERLTRIAGLSAESLEVAVQSHQISIHINNSNLNDASSLMRETDATQLAAAVEQAISPKPEFAQIAVIHINYVRKSGTTSKLVQGVDFYKSGTGTFVIHKS